MLISIATKLKEILGGNCLSDMTINLAQSILCQQFSSVLGRFQKLERSNYFLRLSKWKYSLSIFATNMQHYLT